MIARGQDNLKIFAVTILRTFELWAVAGATAGSLLYRRRCSHKGKDAHRVSNGRDVL
jgi:hypothetical protein